MRIDGRGFHQFAKAYDFVKPNDKRALDVMNQAARAVMGDVQGIWLAYGDSDEYSFVFDRDTSLFDRRESKIVSTIVSTFTANYVWAWKSVFGADNALRPRQLPTFDGRAITYPNLRAVRDYFSWRQADCHINNLYNTTFWALVDRGGLTASEAETRLQGTLASDKNEILFSQFGINYNNEPEMFRKGTVIRWADPARRKRSKLETVHCDIIKDDGFWTPYCSTLCRATGDGGKKGAAVIEGLT